MRLDTHPSDYIHILALLYIRREHNLTSTQLEGIVNNNPSAIRKLIFNLKEVELVNISKEQ